MFDPLGYFDDDEYFDTNVIFVHKAHAVLKVTIVHPCPTHSLFISPFPSPLLPPPPPSSLPLSPSLSISLALSFIIVDYVFGCSCLKLERYIITPKKWNDTS